jgi:Pyridoxamine 5'-phosphate oxidase
MDDQQRAAQRWAETLSAPTDQNKAALAELLAEDAVSVSPMGNAEGKVAILAGFGQSPIGALFAQAKWSEPASGSKTVDMTCTFPAQAPIGGITLHLVFDEDDRINRIETGILPAAPPQATSIKINETMRVAVDGAFVNRTPITVAYVDRDGQPHLSLRGTTQVFSDDQLAIWIRNPEGGLLSAIENNPRLALLYRDPATRTTYQFYGRGHIDRSEETADQVYSNSPEFERNMDPQRRGIAVVVDLDRVEGRDASGALVMERSPGK